MCRKKCDNVGYVTGKNGEVVKKGNGMRLLQFCAENDPGIAKSWFLCEAGS